jgi:hypothetical protein
MEVSEQAFYRWKKHYGGLAVNEIRRRWGLPRGADLTP